MYRIYVTSTEPDKVRNARVSAVTSRRFVAYTLTNEARHVTIVEVETFCPDAVYDLAQKLCTMFGQDCVSLP